MQIKYLMVIVFKISDFSGLVCATSMVKRRITMVAKGKNVDPFTNIDIRSKR